MTLGQELVTCSIVRRNETPQEHHYLQVIKAKKHLEESLWRESKQWSHRIHPPAFFSSHFPSSPPAGSRAVGENRLWSRRKHAATEKPHTQTNTNCAQTAAHCFFLRGAYSNTNKESPPTAQVALLVCDLYCTPETLARLRALKSRVCVHI